MTYTLPETLWLAEQGFEDLLLAYPTADVGALGGWRCARPPTRRGAGGDGRLRSAPGDDRVGARRRRAPMRVCIDIDASWWALGGRVKIGAKRSPVRTAEQAVDLAREIDRRPQIDLVALMAYEGQIAGVGDRPPGRRMRGAAIRFMQRRSAAELAERRAAIVAASREVAELEFVNGGGTGSLELTVDRGGGDRGDGGVGVLRPHPVRPLQPLQPHPRRGLRAAGRPQARAEGRDRARRRLPRLRRPATRRGCRPLAARRAQARQAGGRRRGPDAAARDAAAELRSATASTSATPRPASSASASTPST